MKTHAFLGCLVTCLVYGAVFYFGFWFVYAFSWDGSFLSDFLVPIALNIGIAIIYLFYNTFLASPKEADRYYYQVFEFLAILAFLILVCHATIGLNTAMIGLKTRFSHRSYSIASPLWKLNSTDRIHVLGVEVGFILLWLAGYFLTKKTRWKLPGSGGEKEK
ncbi:hypothetical protein ACVR0O_04290 [Streptococcus caviae]|uniref:hypothetical protein n=1 Tax=Streptococcus sp. 'caviae' TaxID=1915004 RepID=UPI001156B51E|nr:hypothetical protein [Streptococcus sp. 'caviae']